MSRVRIQLSETLAASGASCTQLWWPAPSSAQEIKQLVSGVLLAVGLTNLPLDAINVTLSGFTVLLNSSTALLRDGDLLEIDFAGQSKKRKRPRGSDTAPAITPAPKKAAVADKDGKTPVGTVIVVPLSETRPSRSARRKAAKRLRKRQGLDVSFPLNGRRNQQQQQQAAPNGRFKATALAAVNEDKQQSQKKKFSGSSSSSEEEKSVEEEEETTSSANGTTTSSDTISSPSSSSSSENEGKEETDHEEQDKRHNTSNLVQNQADLDNLFPSLPMCNGMPAVGRVVAYKLLEIREDFAPRISEARLGKVVVADATEELVIIEPHPDPSIHPLQPINANEYNRYLKENLEEEEEREPPPSCYDETGVLTAELASFSEFKYFDSVSEVAGTGARREVDVQKEVAALPLGPTEYSRLGPPRIAAAVGASGATPPVPVVRDPEVLASLVEQLQQRRAEIASAKASEELLETDQQAVANKSNTNQKSKNPRHWGALQSAIGPMLRTLRNSEKL